MLGSERRSELGVFMGFRGLVIGLCECFLVEVMSISGCWYAGRCFDDVDLRKWS
ncbi:unnamed protein product [Rhodiola kirilowii]